MWDHAALSGALLFLGAICLSGGARADTFELPSRRGEFHLEESWVNDPDTGDDVLRGYVRFTPSRSLFPECRSLRAAQIARVQITGGKDLVWDEPQQNRNFMMTKAGTPGVEPGFFVDHDASKCAPKSTCSIYYRDYWPNADESADGSASRDSAILPVSLVDYPYGWTQFEQIKLETCVFCADTETPYDCVSWGARWPITADRTFLPARANPGPSATFTEALKRFHDFYL